MKKYAYFFTRQDIIPEQQIVQTAHAALKLGVNNANIEADTTYFALIGVRNLDALLGVEMILEALSFEYEIFYEDDLNGEATSIAVVPLNEFDRKPLLAFNKLVI